MSESSWPRAVLFDLDGTLIDSLPDIHAALNETLASLGEPPFTPEAVAQMVGGGVQVLIRRAFEALDKDIDPASADKIAERYLAIYSARSTELTTLNAGASATVRELHERGIRLGVVTNKPEHETHEVLRHFGLDELMEIVIGGDAGPRRKPAPDLILLACQRLGIEPGDALFVGDSENDVEAALAAAMPVAAVRGGYSRVPTESMGAGCIIDRLDELDEAIEALRPEGRA